MTINLKWRNNLNLNERNKYLNQSNGDTANLGQLHFFFFCDGCSSCDQMVYLRVCGKKKGCAVDSEPLFDTCGSDGNFESDNRESRRDSEYVNYAPVMSKKRGETAVTLGIQSVCTKDERRPFGPMWYFSTEKQGRRLVRLPTKKGLFSFSGFEKL